MNPRWAFAFKLIGALILIILLAMLYPPAMEFIERAGRELRYFWWLILLLALALWLFFGLGSKKK
jgi:hypothetical protein